MLWWTCGVPTFAPPVSASGLLLLFFILDKFPLDLFVFLPYAVAQRLTYIVSTFQPREQIGLGEIPRVACWYVGFAPRAFVKFLVGGACTWLELFYLLPLACWLPFPHRRVILTAHPFRAFSCWVPQLFVHIVLFICFTFSVRLPFFYKTRFSPLGAQDPFLVSLDFSFPLLPTVTGGPPAF